MANNKVSSLLNVDLPKPKRANFNLGRVNRFTADVGWDIPCYTEEILPNSYKRLDVEGLIQTNATVAPLMGTFKVKIDAFFVPLRLYYPHLDLNNIRPNFTDNFDYHYINLPSIGDNSNITETNLELEGNPAMTRDRIDEIADNYDYYFYTGFAPGDMPTIGVSPSSLIDYLGIIPANFSPVFFHNTPKLNANTLLAYFDIWRNFYANPHDEFVPFRVKNRIDSEDIDQRFNFGLDKYVKLEQFDNLFADLHKLSISSTNQPVAQNVYNLIKRNLQFNEDAQSDTSPSFYHPPFFANEIVATDVNGGADDELYEFLSTSNGMHFGLLPRTYQDDYFNSRFRNDFVTYAEERSKLVVQNNEIYISQLRLQNRTAKYVDKSIFSDTRFGAWVKSHFGVKTNQKLNIPQFLGSISTNIVFNDIYATAQTGNGDITSNQALGSRSSLGQGYLKNKGSFIEFKATEPGYLMCMFSIIPQVSYFQGIKKMFLKTSFADMYKPEFDAVGYDDLQQAELSVIPFYSGNTHLMGDTIDFEKWNKSVGKHPAWLEYMTSYDEAHGLMTKRNEFGYWLLNRPFTPNAYDENANALTTDFNASTYIRPEYFNTIFAVDKFTDNFQVQLRFYDKTKQPISKQILPHL